ncbi:MAG: hypothetical protein JOZ18_21920, partial [Chloroflexi bacterium]|nr:hypothetical protein [Chloroflexota bacterium]
LSCMKRGDQVCRFEVLFEGESWAKRATPEMIESEKRRLSKQGLSNLVLQALSHHEQESKTLNDIKILVDQNQGPYFPEIYKEQRNLAPVHISQLHTTLTKLQQVGLVASTINRPEDTFLNRRYWRTRTSD